MQLLTGKHSDEKYRGELVTKDYLEDLIVLVEGRLKKINLVQ
jgi:hypothetical protein